MTKGLYCRPLFFVEIAKMTNFAGQM